MEELSLHILDIVENSVSAGATLVEIRIEYRFGEKPWLTITVRDNGRGMSPEVAGRVSDPFYTTRTTRKVGLGTALFRQTAELAGGSFRVWSEPGKGTEVTAELNPLHLDAVPMGECWSRPVPGWNWYCTPSVTDGSSPLIPGSSGKFLAMCLWIRRR